MAAYNDKQKIQNTKEKKDEDTKEKIFRRIAYISAVWKYGCAAAGKYAGAGGNDGLHHADRFKVPFAQMRKWHVFADLIITCAVAWAGAM